ncbi:mitogen-activated protein kinase kinase kinase 4-like [Haliotis cracherodii]|uniref:mitogen-activated protein kinase kinase kinase 4-like n=1 Tax=Haliotis cracherodii TaxID=6455 RepID=UPI0039ED33FA
MADDEDDARYSRSPREDYDPLKDDRRNFVQADDGEVSPGEQDSNFDNGGFDDDDYSTQGAFQYSVTPPSQPRMRKRASRKLSGKGKQGTDSYKEWKEYLGMKKTQPQPRTPVNIIKEQYGDDPGLCKLSGTDSDDNLDRDIQREKKDKRRKDKDSKRLMTKSRGHERFVKRLSDDFTESSENQLNKKIVSMYANIDLNKSNTFSSLQMPVNPIAITPNNRMQREAAVPIECPKERFDFYNIFSTLINMGSQNKKDKDRQLASCYKRQLSSEQEMWQNRVNDVIWIELHAWFRFCSLDEAKEHLNFEREKVMAILEEIINFKMVCQDMSDVDDDTFHEHEVSKTSPVDKLCGRVSPGVSASFQSLNLTSDMVDCQREALSCVKKLLDDLDDCESLYPTTKAFAKENDLYASEQFNQRVKSLCLWLNITRDLCHKMKLLGRVLGVQNVHGLDWPMIDYESPRASESACVSQRPSIPNILETVPSDSDADDEAEEAAGGGKQFLSPTDDCKKVKFVGVYEGDEKSSRPESPCINENTLPPLGTSTPMKRGNIGSFATSISRESSEVSLEELNKTSVYRHYVDKCLKKMGMQKLVIRLRDVLDRSLQRAREALEKPKLTTCEGGEKDKSPSASDLASSPSLVLLPEVKDGIFYRSTSLSEHGAWSQEFIKMGLPSFRPSYLFLVRIPLDVSHECLRLRLEQRPLGDPSFLSVRQLIRECKEVLKGAVLVKQYYQHMVASVMWDDNEAEEKFATDLEQFDNDMKAMLDDYFKYLQSWISALQSLPEASRSLKNALEEEWMFTKYICPHVIGGEAEAGKKFSTMVLSLLLNIADFLENGIDDCTSDLYDLTAYDNDRSDQEYSDDSTTTSNKEWVSDYRHTIQHTCRNFKILFHEARERASKALGFAKMLRKDLEIASDFNISVTTREILDKLEEKNHVRVIAPLSSGYMMFIPHEIMCNTRLILQLLNVTCGREESTAKKWTDEDGQCLVNEGYLLMLRCEGGIDHVSQCPLWEGEKVHMELTAETAIALSHIEVESLLLVVIHSSQLSSQRKEFNYKMGDTISLVNEQTSCHQSIAESLASLKNTAIEMRENVATAISQVDEKLNFDDIAKLEDSEKNHILKLYRETMLQCYNFGFEYYKEVSRLVSGDQRQRLGRGLVKFAKSWMKFVSEKCERGRGMRPRWANQGLDFLTVACEPKVLACLSEDEFQELKKNINDCITHVIGSADKGGHWPHGKSVAEGNFRHPMQRFPSCPEPSLSQKMVRSNSSRSTFSEGIPHVSSGLSTPSTPSPSILDASSQCESLTNLSRKERIKLGCRRLEEERNQKMRDKRVIGRTTSRQSEIDYHINVRRVNFRWQRGNKIGEGQFGKVYTAVNMETGELMALKEMKMQPNDQQGFKEIADEIKNFEGNQHKHLVKYYGVEVHKDEMLIFMEYCDCGTVEEAAKIGLPEHIIRKYTKQILIAVNHLHENSIVHRDIKGANIFLTSNGTVKVGDFGCSVKLKNHTTMLGEINSLAGTMAYMAPEVITQNDKEGSGRAADIWSLGCVVIEMATGKRPWHDAENNYQIMFKVGMGGTPSVPENLSAEGKDFLLCCFQHDPQARWTASRLQDHPFSKVYEEADGES